MVGWLRLSGKISTEEWTERMATWWPIIKIQRLKALYKIRKSLRYRGDDDLHPSLSLDVASMLMLTESEQSVYLTKLIRVREEARQRYFDKRREAIHISEPR